MVTSKKVDEQSDEYCKYNTHCEKIASNTCRGCQQKYCVDHYLEHHRRLKDYFEHVRQTQSCLTQKLNSLISQLSADDMLDSMQEIYEFQMQASEIETTMHAIQEQVQDLVGNDQEDLEKPAITITHELESDQEGDDLESDIERLRKDIEELQSKIEAVDTDAESNDSLHVPNSSLPGHQSARKKSFFRSIIDASKHGFAQPVDDSMVLSHLLLKPVSPAVIGLDESDLVLTDDEIDLSLDDETIGIVDTNSTARASRKIRLSNNIVKWLRGPFKVMIDGTLHAAEMCAQGIPISDAVMKAIDDGLARHRQSNSTKPVYTEVTSDWVFEGKNLDCGFSSASIWMRDPNGRRILVKTQEHPLCAANEWLAYSLGSLLGLSVNEVQIGIYEKNLVTLHTDVKRENEKVVTFMDLPKHMRKMLLTDATMESMDLFDHILQNVDRNPRNILIAMPESSSLDDEPEKLKIHLIDHSSCFGMGKLNVISIIACKLHSQHLAVIKFDPVDKARKFELYLSKLPSNDRLLVRKTLNRLGALTDERIDQMMNEVKDLLSPGQFDRIRDVLCRQRDVTKRYTNQWGISPRTSSIKEQPETIVYF